MISKVHQLILAAMVAVGVVVLIYSMDLLGEYEPVNRVVRLVFVFFFAMPVGIGLASGLVVLKHRTLKIPLKIYPVGLALALFAVGVLYMNADGDMGLTEEHRVKVVEMRMDDENKVQCHIKMQGDSLYTQGKQREVPQEFYNKLSKGQDITVVTKPGRLGITWVKELKP